MNRLKISLLLFITFSIIVVACSAQTDFPEAEKVSDSPNPTQKIDPTQTREVISPTPVSEPTQTEYPGPEDIPGYYQMIPFDGIRPVYDPQFATVAETENLMFDEELVMGVAWGGEAKAYPVTVMRFREMVNDELAGIPTLVTW